MYFKAIVLLLYSYLFILYSTCLHNQVAELLNLFFALNFVTLFKSLEFFLVQISLSLLDLYLVINSYTPLVVFNLQNNLSIKHSFEAVYTSSLYQIEFLIIVISNSLYSKCPFY